eukprot:2226563-Pyramimonas_sp.AAC.1
MPALPASGWSIVRIYPPRSHPTLGCPSPLPPGGRDRRCPPLVVATPPPQSPPAHAETARLGCTRGPPLPPTPRRRGRKCRPEGQLSPC